MRIILCLLLMIFLLHINCYADVIDELKVSKLAHFTDIHASGLFVTGEKFNVEISTKRFVGGNAQKDYYGVDGWMPKRVVSSIKVLFKDEEIVFPEKSYVDLADISLSGPLEVRSSNNVIFLSFNGGDGIAGYEAVYKIINGKLGTRLIYFTNPQGKIDTAIVHYQ